MENQLLVAINDIKIPEVMANEIAEKYNEFYPESVRLISESETIKITDVSQVEEMQKAREIRLRLQKLRVSLDKTRKDLKEESKNRSDAIDSMARYIRVKIEKAESHLMEQEKFIENIEKERLEKLKADRERELTLICEPGTDLSFYNLGEMPDSVYDSLKATFQKSHEARLEAERNAEQERIQKEKEEKERQEAIRIENERLKREAEEREAQYQKEKEEREKQQKLEEEKRKKDQEEINKKLEAERKEKEKIEAEKRKLEEEKKKKLEEEERQKAEQEEKKRKEALAPDKEKAIIFLNNILVSCIPEISDPGIKSILSGAMSEINQIIVKSKSKMDQL